MARASLGHFDQNGQAVMIDIGAKAETHRIAVATGSISMKKATLRDIGMGVTAKGDVLGVARVAAIQAAKRTAELIPLAHPIPLTKVAVDFRKNGANSSLQIVVRAESVGKTGVEMEAMTAATVGLLTVYDMCKGRDRAMVIGDIFLVEKSGGKSGLYRHSRTIPAES